MWVFFSPPFFPTTTIFKQPMGSVSPASSRRLSLWESAKETANSRGMTFRARRLSHGPVPLGPQEPPYFHPYSHHERGYIFPFPFPTPSQPLPGSLYPGERCRVSILRPPRTKPIISKPQPGKVVGPNLSYNHFPQSALTTCRDVGAYLIVLFLLYHVRREKSISTRRFYGARYQVKNLIRTLRVLTGSRAEKFNQLWIAKERAGRMAKTGGGRS